MMTQTYPHQSLTVRYKSSYYDESSAYICHTVELQGLHSKTSEFSSFEAVHVVFVIPEVKSLNLASNDL
jgi:hypothetical protein